MAELKKCPFCGGEAELEYERIDGYYQKYYSWVHVVCKKCYATTPRTYDDKDRSKKYAVKAWNNRVTEAEIRAKAIDEFAKKLRKLFEYESAWGETQYHQRYVVDLSKIDEIAEQLKGE